MTMSFEEISEATGMRMRVVVRCYYKGLAKLQKYAKEHPELRDYLEQENDSSGNLELLRAIYDPYGRERK